MNSAIKSFMMLHWKTSMN